METTGETPKNKRLNTIPMENYETHIVCNKRLKELGGKSPCCECEPHEGCELKEQANCEMCKLVDELKPSLSYCEKHNYPPTM